MKPNLNASPEQIEMFRRWSSLGSDLETLAKEIDNFDRPPLTSRIASDHLARLLKAFRETDRDELLFQLAALRRVMEQADSSPKETVESLCENMSLSDFSPTERDQWKKQVAPSIEKFLGSEFFRIFSKSARLSYDYAMIAGETRVITDARPVFAEDLNSLNGMIVSFVLRLEYQTAEQVNTLSIALDHSDVLGLYLECERALKKSEALVRCLGNGQVIPAAIAGEQDIEPLNE